MSELNKVAQEQNPIVLQAEFADEVRDKAEIREAAKAAQKYHTRLQLEEIVDLDGNGDGRTRDSRLLNIYANHSIRG